MGIRLPGPTCRDGKRMRDGVSLMDCRIKSLPPPPKKHSASLPAPSPSSLLLALPPPHLRMKCVSSTTASAGPLNSSRAPSMSRL